MELFFCFVLLFHEILFGLFLICVILLTSKIVSNKNTHQYICLFVFLGGIMLVFLLFLKEFVYSFFNWNIFCFNLNTISNCSWNLSVHFFIFNPHNFFEQYFALLINVSLFDEWNVSIFSWMIQIIGHFNWN